MNFKIECKVVDKDVNNYASIYEFIKGADKTFPTPISERADISKLTGKLLEQAIVLQATVNNKIVGLSSFYANDKLDFIAHWTFLAVNPDYRNKGIASTLIAEMLSILKQEQMLSVDVLTDTVNIRARKLYEKLGFVLVEEIDGRARYSYYLAEKGDKT